jgi:hypothetical protein
MTTGSVEGVLKVSIRNEAIIYLTQERVKTMMAIAGVLDEPPKDGESRDLCIR